MAEIEGSNPSTPTLVMKSEELEALIREELEERGLNPRVNIKPNENEYIVKFSHMEDCGECDDEEDFLWKIGNEFVYYGQTDEEVKELVEKEVGKIAERNENMLARRDFPSKEFVEWLDEEGGYNISFSKVEEEYPEFFEIYDLGSVTMKMGDDGESYVPVRDFIDCVKYGHVRD